MAIDEQSVFCNYGWFLSTSLLVEMHLWHISCFSRHFQQLQIIVCGQLHITFLFSFSNSSRIFTILWFVLEIQTPIFVDCEARI